MCWDCTGWRMRVFSNNCMSPISSLPEKQNGWFRTAEHKLGMTFPASQRFSTEKLGYHLPSQMVWWTHKTTSWFRRVPIHRLSIKSKKEEQRVGFLCGLAHLSHGVQVNHPKCYCCDRGVRPTSEWVNNTFTSGKREKVYLRKKMQIVIKSQQKDVNQDLHGFYWCVETLVLRPPLPHSSPYSCTALGLSQRQSIFCQ